MTAMKGAAVASVWLLLVCQSALAEPSRSCIRPITSEIGSSTSVSVAANVPLTLRFDAPVKLARIQGTERVSVSRTADSLTLAWKPTHSVSLEASVKLMVTLNDGFGLSIIVRLSNQAAYADDYLCLVRDPRMTENDGVAAVPIRSNSDANREGYCYKTVAFVPHVRVIAETCTPTAIDCRRKQHADLNAGHAVSSCSGNKKAPSFADWRAKLTAWLEGSP